MSYDDADWSGPDADDDRDLPPVPEGWSTHKKNSRHHFVTVYATGEVRISAGIATTVLDNADRVTVLCKPEETKLAIRATDDPDNGFAMSDVGSRGNTQQITIKGPLKQIGIMPSMLPGPCHPRVEYDHTIEALVLDCVPVVERMVGEPGPEPEVDEP